MKNRSGRRVRTHWLVRLLLLMCLLGTGWPASPMPSARAAPVAPPDPGMPALFAPPDEELPSSLPPLLTEPTSSTADDGELARERLFLPTVRQGASVALATAALTATTPFSANINFQTPPIGIPAGYVADTGAVYGDRGNGYTYGWNIDNGYRTRTRLAPNAPDLRYDTLNQLTRFDEPPAFWEVAVPNGRYQVRIVAGDPTYIDGDFRLRVEGRAAITGRPTPAQPWLDQTVTVDVQDGRLTVDSGPGGFNTRMNFLDITAAAGSFALKVNFQTPPIGVPAGYLADVGQVYADRGNGYTYGWDVDNQIRARTRLAPNAPELRYDSLNHLTHFNEPPATWELAVPNGPYQVTLVAGDPAAIDSVYRLTLEDQLVLDATPTATTRWFTSTVALTVTDGRLTLGSAPGAVNNKINFIEIRSPDVPPPPGQVVRVAIAPSTGVLIAPGDQHTLQAVGFDAQDQPISLQGQPLEWIVTDPEEFTIATGATSDTATLTAQVPVGFTALAVRLLSDPPIVSPPASVMVAQLESSVKVIPASAVEVPVGAPPGGGFSAEEIQAFFEPWPAVGIVLRGTPLAVGDLAVVAGPKAELGRVTQVVPRGAYSLIQLSLAGPEELFVDFNAEHNWQALPQPTAPPQPPTLAQISPQAEGEFEMPIPNTPYTLKCKGEYPGASLDELIEWNDFGLTISPTLVFEEDEATNTTLMGAGIQATPKGGFRIGIKDDLKAELECEIGGHSPHPTRPDPHPHSDPALDYLDAEAQDRGGCERVAQAAGFVATRSGPDCRPVRRAHAGGPSHRGIARRGGRGWRYYSVKLARVGRRVAAGLPTH